MTRKRRGRAKSVVVPEDQIGNQLEREADPDFFHVHTSNTCVITSNKTNGGISHTNESLPVLSSVEKDEDAILAWKGVMALILDCYLKKMNTQIEKQRDTLNNLTLDDDDGPLLLKLGQVQAVVSENINSLEEKMKQAKEMFKSNMLRMDAGEKFRTLPLVDPSMTLHRLKQMISDYGNEGYVGMDVSTDGPGSTSGDSAIASVAADNSSDEATYTTDITGREGSIEVCSRAWSSEDNINESTADTKQADAQRILELLKPSSQLCSTEVPDLDIHSLRSSSTAPDAVSSRASGTDVPPKLDQQNTFLTQQEIDEIHVVLDSDSEWIEELKPKALDETMTYAAVAGKKKSGSVETNDEDDGGWTTVTKSRKPDNKHMVTQPDSQTSTMKTGSQKGSLYKARLCMIYEETHKCPFGENCVFAHGKAELREAPSWFKSNVVTPATFVPSPMLNGKFHGESGRMRRKTELCRAYKNGICGWGDLCNYAHSEKELNEALSKLSGTKLKNTRPAIPVCDFPPRVDHSIMRSHHVIEDPTPSGNIKFKGENGAKRRKTEMCQNYRLGKCNWGKNCNYAHSLDELVTPGRQRNTSSRQSEQVVATSLLKANPRKLLMCKGFELGTCRMTADECKYAHHKDGLDECFQHPEPCSRQQCAGRLRYERRKTVMCNEALKSGFCKFGEECTYAHTKAELRPPPKHELCQNYYNGKCWSGDECVYAHSKEELRPKPREPQTSSTWANNNTATSHVDSPAYKTLESVDVDEECIICAHKLLDDRIDLECGHSQWHFKCISRWLNEQRPFCPLCEHPAELPDLYQAPAGLEPEDFPTLPLWSSYK